MPTANERLLSAAISHQVDLSHFGNGVIRRLIAILNKADSDLFAQLALELEKMPTGTLNLDRLEQLLLSVRSLNRQAYDSIERALTPELRALAEYEASYQRQLFASAIPAQVVAEVGIAAVDIGQVYSAALARPLQGRLLREWSVGIEAGRMARIRDAVRIGYIEGQTIGQIVQRLRGTRAKGYQDGIIEIDRRHAETIVRSAISHTASVTRKNFYEANGSLIKALRWVSTIDGRTSTICMLRDGKQFTPDTHSPIDHSLPWLAGPGQAHFGCRSVDVPILKSWRDLGLDIDEMKPTTRASMDGQIPADMSYGAWLSKQGAERQDEILGPTRGKLMRESGLTLDRFANDKGKWLNLDQLRARDFAAFAKAGL